MGDNSGTGEWQFCVLADTAPGETLAVVGDCAELGLWNLQKAVDLQCGHEGNVWRVTIRLPRGKSITYRYLVCVLVPSDGEQLMEMARVVKRWETHPQPRKISQQDLERAHGREDPEEFGLVYGHQHVERGWLTSESVVQLKIFGDEPIKMWKRRLLHKQVLVKVTPIVIVGSTAPERLAKSCDSLDESMDTLELSNNGSGKSGWPITELSVMGEDDCEFKTQAQFGRAYKQGDFFIYQIQVLFPEHVTYLVDFYALSNSANEDDVPTHVGFSYVLPSVMKSSEGQAIVPITGLRHQPIGQLTVEYLKVAPLPNEECDLSEVFSRYWSHNWCGLDVGHRGAGNSFKMQKVGMAEIRENTIASLTEAARHGADFVEFDVQLSKDLIPVIYHDFHVIISMKQKNSIIDNDILTLPVKDLSLRQLHLLKVYHLEEGKQENLQPRFFDDDLEDHQPFPTLKLALEKLDEHVGFNIEIKWTMQLKDGTYELYHPFDLNLYLDIVLETVLKHGGHRKIVFSCFHPDICAMIRLKQNKYPVMFLTQGATSKYPMYNDPRCHNILGAIYFAKAAGILGVNAHTEDLLRDPTLVQAVRDAGLVLFCWGDDNNDTNTIKHLKSLGLHGVIYDKIDQLGCKEVKESIFLVEARESERQKFAAIGMQNQPQSPVDAQGCGQESEDGPNLNLAPTASASGTC